MAGFTWTDTWDGTNKKIKVSPSHLNELVTNVSNLNSGIGATLQTVNTAVKGGKALLAEINKVYQNVDAIETKPSGRSLTVSK